MINLGNLMSRWTNEKYKSNIYRVINKSGRERYSIPLFVSGNPDYIVDCIFFVTANFVLIVSIFDKSVLHTFICLTFRSQYERASPYSFGVQRPWLKRSPFASTRLNTRVIHSCLGKVLLPLDQ